MEFTRNLSEHLQNISRALEDIRDTLKASNTFKGMTHHEFLDTRQACCYLNISEPHIRKLIFHDKIPVIRLGKKKLLFKKTDLETWIAGYQ